MPAALVSGNRRRRGTQKEHFVDAETMPNNTLTKTIGQFEQMVNAVEQWRQTLAEGTSKRVLFDYKCKIDFEKLAKIYKIAVGQFGALAVEGCTLAKGTKLGLTTIYTFNVIDAEQIMRVTNSAPAKLFKGSWVQIPDAFTVLDLVHNDALEKKIRGRICGARRPAGCGKIDGPLIDLPSDGAEFCGARACARPWKPLGTRAKVTEERKFKISARARPRGTRASESAIGRVNSARVVRGNT